MLRLQFSWKSRQMRMVAYLLIVSAVATWKFVPRPWHPSFKQLTNWLPVPIGRRTFGTEA